MIRNMNNMINNDLGCQISFLLAMESSTGDFVDLDMWWYRSNFLVILTVVMENSGFK